jgi:hypothetical membrane protein
MLGPDRTTAGILFLVAGAQFVLGLVLAEALYPGYSVSVNYVSDLGIGPSSWVFNSSVFLLGLLSIAGSYLLPRRSDFRVLTVFLAFMAIGAMGTGIFTKALPTVHGAVSSMAFLFGGLSAIASFKVLRMPLSAISVVLGMVTLGALGLFAGGLVTAGALTSSEPPASEFFLGLGPGGMERMTVYPAFVWLISFGAHLIAVSGKAETPE